MCVYFFSSIDPVNGLTTFMSRKEGNFAVAVQLKEYRNGILLSTSILDLQILVFQCTPNAKPKFSQFKETHEVEAGEEICFIYTGTDSDPGDRVTIKAYGDMFTGANGFKGNKATFAERTATNTVGSQFCWKTDCDQARAKPYVFTIELLDDGCPSKFTNKNVSIIVKPFVSVVEFTGPLWVCRDQIYDYVAVKGKTGSTYNWTADGGQIISGQGTDKIKVKWGLGPNKLSVKEISKFGCPGTLYEKDISVYPAVPSPSFTGKDSVCLNNVERYTALDKNNVSNYKWFVSGGTILGNKDSKSIDVLWNVIGKGYLKLVHVSPDGCESDTFSITIDIIKLEFPNKATKQDLKRIEEKIIKEQKQDLNINSEKMNYMQNIRLQNV